MASKSGSTTKKRSAASTSRQPSIGLIVMRLIDVFYDLAQTGNLIGLILIAIVLWAFYVTYKLPPESLVIVLGGIGHFLASEKFYFFPLGSALVVSVATNAVQARVYRAHIHDLTEHRRVLVHGLESGELKPLKNHISSGFDITSDTLSKARGDENAHG